MARGEGEDEAEDAPLMQAARATSASPCAIAHRLAAGATLALALAGVAWALPSSWVRRRRPLLSHHLAATDTDRALRLSAAAGSDDVALAAITTTESVCTDTPGWTNGYSACNNYQPVDQDCTEKGVTCHFYERKPSFCIKGLNAPWRHCCACGGGSAYNGSAPTTTEPSLYLPHIPGMPHLKDLDLPGYDTFSHELGKFKHKVSQELAPIEDAVGEVYDGLNSPDIGKPPKLGGNSVDEINTMVLHIVALVSGVTVLGFFADFCFQNCLTTGRPRLWSVALLATSYGLLIPGLSSVVFSFDIVVDIVGHRVNVQPDTAQDSCTESVWGLIHLLYETGSKVGAALIFLYAIVVPAVKVSLLVLGELLRFSSSSTGVGISRMSILLVQYISKWASPDMFTYILLVHLVRDLNHPDLILTAAQLDIGFSCFSAFCVCSTISSLGIGVPKHPASSNAEVELAAARPPLLLCCVGRRGAIFVVLLLAIAFAALFGAGVYRPCMALRIDQERLYPPRGPLPYSAKPVVEALAIPELLHSDVSVWKCITTLAGDLGGGEANSVFALIMWAVFVAGFTVLDVLMLVLAAARLRMTSAPAKADENGLPQLPGPCPFMLVARVLRKLAMLDVAIMGVLVMTFSLQMYAKDGIVVSVREGMFVLLAAEVVHTAAFCVVSSATDYVALQAGLSAADEANLSQCRPSRGPCGCSRQHWLRGAKDEKDSVDTSVHHRDFSLSCCVESKRRPRLPQVASAAWPPADAHSSAWQGLV